MAARGATAKRQDPKKVPLAKTDSNKKKRTKVIEGKVPKKRAASRSAAAKSRQKSKQKPAAPKTNKPGNQKPAVKAEPPAKAKKLREAPLVKTTPPPAPVPEPSQIPVFLTTPSEELLKSFRAASKRSRALAIASKPRRFPGATFLAKPLKKGKKYVIDLRVHSPGTLGYFSTGGVEAGAALVRLAKVKGLDVIAITDYYNACYIDLVQQNAQNSTVTLLPGFTVRCSIGNCKEVFLICLFPEGYGAGQLFAVLDDLKVPSEAYGSREFLLTKDFGEVVKLIEGKGGIVIPSRIDKTPYRQSVIPVLIEQYGFHAFDLVHPENTDYFKERWPFGAFTFFSFSNANALAQIGSRITRVRLASPGFEGIKELVARRPS